MTCETFIEDCLQRGLLKKHECDFNAIDKLIQRVHKDLKAAKANLDIDESIAYTIAYTAMLRMARTFIVLRGFRPADGYQHKTVVEFMKYFLGESYDRITTYFDRMRRKRNKFTYEEYVSISKTEAENAIENAIEFVNIVKGIIKKENPQIGFGSIE